MLTFQDANPSLPVELFEELYVQCPRKLAQVFETYPSLDPNYCTTGGISPLMNYVIYYNNYSNQCIQILIDHGAEVNLRSDRGFSAIMYTVLCRDDRCKDTLLRNGADVSDITNAYEGLVSQENIFYVSNY